MVQLDRQVSLSSGQVDKLEVAEEEDEELRRLSSQCLRASRRRNATTLPPNLDPNDYFTALRFLFWSLAFICSLKLDCTSLTSLSSTLYYY